MFYKLAVLNANIGDVLYMRKDGKVVAVKLVKLLCGKPTPSCGHGVYAWLLIAGEGDEPQMMFLNNKTTKFYRTIEDCIKNFNSVESSIMTEKDLAERCGIGVESMCTSFGMGYWGCWKFIWDGYQPKRISLNAAFDLNFICDENGWHGDLRDSAKKETRKYYDTYEECIADNEVKVVVF